jgi:uncharacterized membrane protein YeaQ/YmgE (transglycosylase-associated protein family)
VEFLIVGLAAGWTIGKIRRGRGYGLVGNLAIGAIGSFVGWFLTGFLKVQAPNIFAEIAMAVVGAIVFFLLVGMVRFLCKKKTSEEEE